MDDSCWDFCSNLYVTFHCLLHLWFLGIHLRVISISVNYNPLNFAIFLYRKLIKFIKDRNQPFEAGLIFAFGLFILALFQSIVNNHYFDAMFTVSAKIRCSLMNLVYKKVYDLSAIKIVKIG